MIVRKLMIGGAVCAAMVLGLVSGVGATTSPIALVLPQSAAFSILGHSCGGIQEQAFATGFDVTSGYPTGDVSLQTSCGGSGRGGGYHSTTYSAWVSVTWDFTGAVVSSAVLTAAPTNTDPTFSAYDPYGNEVYNEPDHRRDRVHWGDGRVVRRHPGGELFRGRRYVDHGRVAVSSCGHGGCDRHHGRWDELDEYERPVHVGGRPHSLECGPEQRSGRRWNVCDDHRYCLHRSHRRELRRDGDELHGQR